MVKITAVGGYGEIGRNMTFIDFGDEAIVLDQGIHVDNYIKLTNDEDIKDVSIKSLTAGGALPEIDYLNKKNVKAIIPTHAHLDHIGAIPFIASKFKCPILCTPFCAAVLRKTIEDRKTRKKYIVKQINVNSSFKISERLTVEFINITHSTPQTVMVAIHHTSKEGTKTIIYANDFKLDFSPTLGKKPNIRRLKELGDKGVECLIIDSLYASAKKKTPSEIIAKQMLRDVMVGSLKDAGGIIVTTFSSHLARLKSIFEIGRVLNRKVVFLGRSLSKYISAGEEVGIIRFRPEAELIKYRRNIKHKLKQILQEGKEKYLVVCTGNQGEHKAVLPRIAYDEIEFKLDNKDSVVFSCSVIPNRLNIKNREMLEKALEEKGVRIFRDVHVSGHASREDIRDLLNIINPKLILPAHSIMENSRSLKNLAKEMGFKKIKCLRNGDSVEL